MLKYRILTAAILIPLLIWATLALSPLNFVLLLMLIFGMAAWEWSKLTGCTSTFFSCVFVAVTLLLYVIIQMYFALYYTYFFSVALLFWLWAWSAIWLYNRQQKTLGFNRRWVRVIVGVVLIIPAMLACVVLRDPTQFGSPFFLLALFIIFAADTGGYFIGRWRGQRALLPGVSPKKTWEGFYGGVLFALLVAVIGSFLINMRMEQRILLWILSMLTAAVSVVGDLTVSLLKRISGVKDTGTLLPGHGGLLDRLDSVLAAITFFAWIVSLVGY